MASGRRRRGSMEQPPDLAAPVDALAADALSFGLQLDDRRARLAEVVRDLEAESAAVRVLQEPSEALRTAGAVRGGVRAAVGVGLGLFVCAAPFIGGLNLAVAAAMLGGAAVAAVNVSRAVTQDRSAGRVEQLGAQLVDAIQPMAAQLEALQAACGAQERHAAAEQAGLLLGDVRELQDLLLRLAELRRSRRGRAGALGAAVLDQLRDLQALASRWLRLSGPQDATLAAAIVQAAAQSARVSGGFDLMEEELRPLRARGEQRPLPLREGH